MREVKKPLQVGGMKQPAHDRQEKDSIRLWRHIGSGAIIIDMISMDAAGCILVGLNSVE